MIYAGVDINDINVIRNGGDPDNVRLIPLGFAIHPDGPGQNVGEIVEGRSGGSLLTVTYQIQVDEVPIDDRVSHGPMSTVFNLIKCTADRIKLEVVRDPNV